ncbi:MAG TPA: hypothetical protein VLM11_17645 [Streptosporangiaceae bacterium]|nr:hypothetical protein [Streptosporangiaceae bacterium]
MLRAGEIHGSPVRGYAVTPALREWYSSGDIEELEYVAMMHAARDSLRLLAADPRAPRRRVVLAVDVRDAEVMAAAGFDEPGQVQLSGPVPVRAVASGLVDDSAAAANLADAIAALPSAAAGDEDAQFIVDGADGHELQWYATQELGDLTS